MKYLFFLFVFTSSISLAQNGINYQGAATDSDGARLANQNISLKTSVLQGGIDGTNSYSETHNTTTDQFGLFNVVVGQGEVVSGDFEGISWGTDAHFLKVELDATGGTNYSLISTTQMMSVPYALYAKNAGLDSLAITSMLESMNFSVNNNRSCDYIFPDGLDGQGIAWDFNENGDYTVPAGKNLYITNVFTYDGYAFRINGMRIMQEMWGFEEEFAPKGMLKLPLYAEAGDIVSNSNNGDVNTFYGILVNKIVEPITYEFYDLGTGFENHYTVPSGKKLVIMNIWAYGGQTNSSKLKIDGVEIAEESFNVAGPYEGKQLYIPLIVNSGSTVYIETSYSSFNGYLVDEDYFADCGGGSTNSSSSEVDSAMVAEMIANSGNGCDMNFPEGLNGEVVITETPYIVPDGKRLYMLSWGGQDALINDIEIEIDDEIEFMPVIRAPLILNSGDSLMQQGNNTTGFSGLLVNETTNLNAITTQITNLNPYEVPYGKKLIILNYNDGGLALENSLEFSAFGETKLGLPIVIPSGTSIYGSNNTTINGYLVNQDFFNNCLGSSNPTPSSIDSAMVAEMIANSGNGCDFKFPEGIGTPVSKNLQAGLTYTVAENKRLYITNVYSSQNGIRLNGEFLYFNDNNNPITVNAGDVIGTYGNNSSHLVQFNGFLVDTTENLSVINKNLQAGMTYTVPENKRLYITNHYSSQNGIRLNGEFLYFNDINNPIMLSGGDVISTYGNNISHVVQFNGFLVDTNYFDNCNMLLSNSNSGGNSNVQMTVSTFGDTLTIGDQSVIIPGISYENFPDSLIGSITDINLNTYQTVKLGNQEWMTQNLRVTNFSNGNALNNNSGSNNSCAFEPGYKENLYGDDFLFYNALAVHDERNICPQGWRIPTVSDYQILLNFLGFNDNIESNHFHNAGIALKSNEYNVWQYSSATNQSLLNFKPDGIIYCGTNVMYHENEHRSWTSTSNGSNSTWYMNLREDEDGSIQSNNQLKFGSSTNDYNYPCRCIKD